VRTAKQDAMIWMNDVFGVAIDAVTAGTPITRKLMIAIGIQETFYIWSRIYKTAPLEDVLALCVGDTIDFPNRATAWPKNKAELLRHDRGSAMFRIAREALERIAAVNPGYRTAARNRNKFCHGFGMFQYDIQFFRSVDPEYFLNGGWKTLSGTVRKGAAELKTQMATLYGSDKARLSHDENVFLAIAYNQGAARTKRNMASRRFKQGHEDRDGVFYGEHIDANLKQMRDLF
jgi:hypothetical protein